MTPDEAKAVCAHYDHGDSPFTTCSFWEPDHLADIQMAAANGKVVALEEAGTLLGFMLAGNNDVVSMLNRIAWNRGAPKGTFSVRVPSQDEVNACPWDVDETLVDKSKGGIIAYLADDHADRLASLLNAEALGRL